MLLRPLFVLFLLGLSFSSWGQDTKLAQQYYVDGEYEKAAYYYQRLYESRPNQDYYFNRYIDCLNALEQFDEAEKAIRQELKKDPSQIQLYVTLGNLYELQFLVEEAEEQYAKAIKKLPEDQYVITKLAQGFTQLTKYDLAIEAYEKGAKLLKNEYIFAFNLGDLYRRKGNSELMIQNYLNSLEENPSRLNSLKNNFQRYLGEEDYQELKKQLYARIQEDQQSVMYPELLIWIFLQEKNYRSALRQVKALDQRLKENGGRVYRVGEIALIDEDFDAAISACQYILDSHGPISSFYLDAKKMLLRAKQLRVVSNPNYSQTDLVALEEEYRTFLDEFGKSRNTAPIMAAWAELEAQYVNNLDLAIEILNEMINLPGVDRIVEARGKIALADYYLMQGERWEATLLYSQVDKEFEEDMLGHEARFRNARLSYFVGDFEWAQAQFEVLKASTSKLIANDALDLSIFIMDNLGLDTTARSLQLYADAELLTFQNRFAEAFAKLDTLSQQFPKHTLQDDVLYAEAQIYLQQRDYQAAAAAFQNILDNYPEEIRADNALFGLAELYEEYLGDPEQAMVLYEKMFIEYSNSTFSVEARKRFRRLRGDDIQ